MTPYETIAAIILLALIIVIGGVLFAINTDEEREDNEREKRDYIDEISNMKR